jgi:hypothetical protein
MDGGDDDGGWELLCGLDDDDFSPDPLSPMVREPLAAPYCEKCHACNISACKCSRLVQRLRENAKTISARNAVLREHLFQRVCSSINTMEPRTMTEVEAQECDIAGIQGLLNNAEIDTLMSVGERISNEIGTISRGAGPGEWSVVPKWTTCYMNSGNLFKKYAPQLFEKIVRSVHLCDAKHLRLLQGKKDVHVRCIEFHTVLPGK